MQAGAKPSHADLHAFAGQLAEVRALDTKGEYKEQLDKLKATYQFVLLQSLDRVHKEMLRAQIPDKLHLIKKQLYELEAAYQFVLCNRSTAFIRRCFEPSCLISFTSSKRSFVTLTRFHGVCHQSPVQQLELGTSKRYRHCLTKTLRHRDFSIRILLRKMRASRAIRWRVLRRQRNVSIQGLQGHQTETAKKTVATTSSTTLISM